MKWKRADANTIRSDEGFSVMRCTVNGVPQDPPRFIAFCHKPNTPLNKLVLGSYDDPQMAKNACEVFHSLTHAEEAKPEEISA